jgi:S-DNA-T family DNA segregation ATPase FtsK/SpoIIIE
MRKVDNHFYVTYKQELIGLALMALFLFISISLLSYNPTDNSWFFFSSETRPLVNWCGSLGANIAALLFFLFGGASYIFALSIFIFTALTFRRLSPIRTQALRLSALPTLISSCALIFHLHQTNIISYEAGGVLGRFLHFCISPILGNVGAALLGYASLWACILIILKISFVQFFNVVGRITIATSTFLAQYGYTLARHITIFFATTAKLFLKGIVIASSFIYTFLRSKLKKRLPPEEPQDDFVQLAQKAPTLSFSPIITLPPSIRTRGEGKLYLRNTIFSPSLFSGDLEESPFIQVLREIKEYQASLLHDEPSILYELPNFSKFQEARSNEKGKQEFEEECRERGKKLEEKLERFGIKGKVTAIRPGPIVTLFEYKPEIDSKISKIISLEDDLAMALTALSIRIIAPIPGRNVIGFEISNQTRNDVFLSEVLEGKEVATFNGKLPLAFGVNITGHPVVYDLVSMPHILVAGSTGSGKSVGLNSMLVSLLCKKTPEELKLILIDPKRLEFAPYADVPHLLFPIVTNPRRAIPVLKWVVQEMEDRYDLMARVGVRNVIDYQKRYHESFKNPSLRNQTAAFRATTSTHVTDGVGAQSMTLPPMPFIVVIIDELADLMMVAGKDVETQIARTAQMARAAGIHMIVATQRPSVDVLTGIIKVNFPARIAFRVSSKIDSRTIIDSSGAEKLLGRGDMLFLDSGSANPERIHGAYVSGTEIARLTNYLKKQQVVEYLDINDALRKTSSYGEENFEDELYDDIKEFVKTIDEVSISLIQRRYRIGFNRSARIIEKLELEGIVAPSQGSKMRKVIR